MPIKRKFLGEMLMDAGLLSPERLAEALRLQRETGKRLGDILKERRWVTEQQIMEMLEFQLGIPFIDLTTLTISQEFEQLVPIQVAQRHTLVPVKKEGGKLYVAMEDPLNIVALDDVRTVSGMEVQPMLARGPAIVTAMNKLYGNKQAEQALEDFAREGSTVEADNAADSSEGVNSAPIVRLVNSLLEQAANARASDVHIEPGDAEVRVRFRVDGSLIVALTTPMGAHAAMVARIKIMSNLDIAEKRRPQDGRLELRSGNRTIDVRVSTIPTVYGEKVVMRLLDRGAFLIPKEQLGMTADNRAKFEGLLRNTHGILLISGPTGSGKTTTLYSMLNELNEPSKNIITIEDPVEYVMDGLNQVQVNAKAGLTFATGLRSILRQDPNIVMVGEIRDQETVEIAIRAAITGHLVLSTIHTNDAASAITRLEDMGVEPYLVSASLVGVMAQRLVRKICPNCSKPVDPDPDLIELLGLKGQPGNYRQGAGCVACGGTGYKGRQAVYEILVVDRRLREMIHNRTPLQQMIDYCRSQGMPLLSDECASLVVSGVITVEEAIRVAYRQGEESGGAPASLPPKPILTPVAPQPAEYIPAPQQVAFAPVPEPAPVFAAAQEAPPTLRAEIVPPPSRAYVPVDVDKSAIVRPEHQLPSLHAEKRGQAAEERHLRFSSALQDDETDSLQQARNQLAGGTQDTTPSFDKLKAALAQADMAESQPRQPAYEQKVPAHQPEPARPAAAQPATVPPRAPSPGKAPMYGDVDKVEGRIETMIPQNYTPPSKPKDNTEKSVLQSLEDTGIISTSMRLRQQLRELGIGSDEDLMKNSTPGQNTPGASGKAPYDSSLNRERKP